MYIPQPTFPASTDAKAPTTNSGGLGFQPDVLKTQAGSQGHGCVCCLSKSLNPINKRAWFPQSMTECLGVKGKAPTQAATHTTHTHKETGSSRYEFGTISSQ